MSENAVTKPILELKAVNKSFGPVQVLHDVDFTIRPGKVTALVGDNGAGKSTLVKCIAGSHPMDSGEIFWSGEPVRCNGPRDAAALGIEVVYQDLALADNLGVAQIRQVLDLVRRLAGHGLGVVLISHNMADVFAVSDRIATLYLGRLVADRPTRELTHSQVVELITAGRSGELGLARPDTVIL